MEPFHTRLRAVTARRGRLCVGIDPHPALISAWGLPHDAVGLERVARGLVAAVGDLAACFKPQSAFYEAYGSAGIAVLERVLSDVRETGALAILDAKRGDIGSSNAGYADAYLADGAPLAADALTMNPYLGVAALAPALTAAAESGRGIYLLCRTSNPEGGDVQLATRGGRSVAQYVVDEAQQRNLAQGSPFVGLVVGATHERLDVDLTGFEGSILVPGLGAQGGTVAGINRLLGERAAQALPTTSRAVMAAGPQPAALRAAVLAVLEEISEAQA